MDFAALATKGEILIPAHLGLLNRRLRDVAAGRVPRLVVTMPPRHGKSFCVSLWLPAWFLCRWPHRRVILSSYEAKFAATWGRKVRDVVGRHGERFFGVRVRPDSKAADSWEIAGHGGGMHTCGVGGPLTGRGADLLIVDDPIKNAEQANSEVYREKTWQWFTSTAFTRLEPGGAVVVVLTRWHEDDLAGRILARAKETGEPWEVLNLPALAGEDDPIGRRPGEALWPDRFDVATLEAKRRTLGSYQFTALYQGAPVPPEGGLFRKSWFAYWTREGEFYRLGPDRRSVRSDQCRRFGTVDLAFSTKKEADYTVIAAWAVSPWSDLILLDLHRERLPAPRLQPSIRAMSERHDLGYIGIEKVLGQSLVVHGARMDGLTVRALVADTDKITRSIPAQVRMEAGQVYLPAGHPELEAIEHELLTFPHGAHDDIVDAVSYAAAEVQRFGPAAATPEMEAERLRADRAAERREREERERAFQADSWADRWWS